VAYKNIKHQLDNKTLAALMNCKNNKQLHIQLLYTEIRPPVGSF